MRRALLCVVVAVLAIGAVACGGSSSSSAQTRTVQVDNTTDKFNGAFLAYFPNNVTVRPGDTVSFHENWTGEPHTVTMGALVESGLKAVQAAGPNAQNGPPPPAFAQLPTLLPQGPGDAHQNAAQPCFLASGAPPSDPNTPCPKAAQPAFDGTQTYYNSGFLAENDTFTVKLSSNIKPGQYHYYCNLHGPQMSGTITVASKDAKIPSTSDVDKQATSQRDAIVNKLVGPYNDAKAGKYPLPGITNVAGYGAQDVENGLVNEFIQPDIKAKVGEKVNWTFIGFHTMSFGKAPIQPGGFIAKAPDGSVHLNPAALAPVGFPPSPEPPNGPPSSGPPTVKTVDGGTVADTTTFKSTGLVQSDPGSQLVAYNLTFSKPGTYTYVCLLHPKMGGVVTVS